FAKTTRYRSHLLDIEDARTYARPLNEARPNGLDPGHRYFNPAGVKLPRRFKEEQPAQAIEALTPRELAGELQSDYQALLKNTFPDEAAVSGLPRNARGKVLQLDERIAQAYERGGLRLPGHAGTLGKVLGGLFDLTNNITRDALLY